MPRFLALVLAALLLLAVPGLAGAAGPSDQAGLARSNNQFALKLLGQLGSQPGNLLFSPLSVSAALTMTYAGARGQTQKQMASVLSLTLADQRLFAALPGFYSELRQAGNQKGQKLAIANALWLAQGLKLLPAYMSRALGACGSSLGRVDFGQPEPARRIINQWVADNTAQMIKDLIPPGLITPQTTMVLSNAVYFLGKWRRPFDQADTAPGPFHLAAGGQVQVPLMHRSGRYPYAEDSQCQVLELPYRGGGLSMVVLLPRPGVELKALQEKLMTGGLESRLAGLKQTQVEVSLPRFKLSDKKQLGQALIQAGMPLAFGDADFSGMTGRKGWSIGAVVHQARVEVDESGTKAAAGTGVVMLTAAPPSAQPKVFKADRPFFFLIRERGQGTVLFLGRLVKPVP